LDWFNAQDAKVKAKFAHVFDLLQEQGTAVGKPYVAPIEDKLYEIRVEQDTNIYRTIYFAYTGKQFILVHGFQKKTQKTPRKEIDLAKERMKAFLDEEKQKKATSQTKGKKSKKGQKR
jgi:phage-related protein